ncbi:hypothetical protein BWQ96_01041 [Gracilariopsis chorda]|uniref:Uncharacterized protein n=1 Tax=Gracilariopsis chorda TaxID=448386 RepID=A0A2V3J555_9FLOR|nr:hypothetical protein BWQ96_01041 [Gracilariopsis chorda]|eukprot:PXF49252.1 hypothetical protein BWQ96_01041 [Gracilariopsis chorda]
MEQGHYRYSPQRVSICKYTLHQLLHLAENVETLGPPLEYSQWWMERYVGWVKHRLNARNLAAESLTENARLLESYKLFFKKGFDEGHSISSGNDLDVEETELAEEGFSLLHYVGAWPVNCPTLRRLNLKSLLADYLTRAKNVAAGAASSCISGDMIEVYRHALVPCDDRLHAVGSWETKRDGAKRSDFLGSAQYASETGVNGRDVYLRFLFKYAFEFPSGDKRALSWRENGDETCTKRIPTRFTHHMGDLFVKRLLKTFQFFSTRSALQRERTPRRLRASCARDGAVRYRPVRKSPPHF